MQMFRHFNVEENHLKHISFVAFFFHAYLFSSLVVYQRMLIKTTAYGRSLVLASSDLFSNVSVLCLISCRVQSWDESIVHLNATIPNERLEICLELFYLTTPSFEGGWNGRIDAPLADYSDDNWIERPLRVGRICRTPMYDLCNRY
jgi:hypothetical protein